MKKLFAIPFLLLPLCCIGQTSSQSSAGTSQAPYFLSAGQSYADLFKSSFVIYPLAKSPLNLKTYYSFSTLPNPCMSGLFCKAEYKMEKMTGLAPRFRLGSVNYTNWMEGKGEYYSRYRN